MGKSQLLSDDGSDDDTDGSDNGSGTYFVFCTGHQDKHITIFITMLEVWC